MNVVCIKYINFWPHFQKLVDSNICYPMYIEHSFKKQGYTIKNCEQIDEANVIVSGCFGNLNILKQFCNKNIFIIFWVTENWMGWSYENIVKVLPINVYISWNRIENRIRKRIPNWIVQKDFTKKAELDFIRKNTSEYVDGNFEKRIHEATLVARYNTNRKKDFIEICKQNNVTVKCPSSLGKNDKSIGSSWDDKTNYIQKYVFNICPENNCTSGWVTEKLFQCVYSGCIPIYWGDVHNEEIFNQNRIILAKNNSNEEFQNCAKTIQNLIANEHTMYEVFKRPLFNRNADVRIQEFLDKIEDIGIMYKNFKSMK